MRAQIKKNLKQFKTLIDIASNLSTEIVVRISTEEMVLESSSSSTSFFRSVLNKSFFDEYEGVDDLFGVSVQDLQKILKKTKDSISFDSGSVMIVVADNNRFKIPTIASSQESRVLPEFKFTIEEELSFDTLLSAVDIVSVAGGATISFYTEDGSLVASGKNSQREAKTVVKNSVNGELDKTTFSSELLSPVVRKDSDSITLKLGGSSPLCVEYNTPGSATTFLLAPRIGEE